MSASTTRKFEGERDLRLTLLRAGLSCREQVAVGGRKDICFFHFTWLVKTYASAVCDGPAAAHLADRDHDHDRIYLPRRDLIPSFRVSKMSPSKRKRAFLGSFSIPKKIGAHGTKSPASSAPWSTTSTVS